MEVPAPSSLSTDAAPPWAAATRATGSGLGLAYVARVAAAHGGAASVDSDEGAGTSIELTIQRA